MGLLYWQELDYLPLEDLHREKKILENRIKIIEYIFNKKLNKESLNEEDYVKLSLMEQGRLND